MKWLLLPLILLSAWFAHGRMVFNESRVMPQVASHTLKVYQGDSGACDFYTDDVQVDLLAEQSGGHWEVEGGKDELCGYLRKAGAAFVVLDAQIQNEFADVSLVRSGFPWTEATLRYTQHVTVRTAKLPEMVFSSEDELVLVRTLTGIKVRSLHSQGQQR